MSKRYGKVLKSMPNPPELPWRDDPKKARALYQCLYRKKK